MRPRIIRSTLRRWLQALEGTGHGDSSTVMLGREWTVGETAERPRRITDHACHEDQPTDHPQTNRSKWDGTSRRNAPHTVMPSEPRHTSCCGAVNETPCGPRFGVCPRSPPWWGRWHCHDRSPRCPASRRVKAGSESDWTVTSYQPNHRPVGVTRRQCSPRRSTRNRCRPVYPSATCTGAGRSPRLLMVMRRSWRSSATTTSSYAASFERRPVMCRQNPLGPCTSRS